MRERKRENIDENYKFLHTITTIPFRVTVKTGDIRMQMDSAVLVQPTVNYNLLRND